MPTGCFQHRRVCGEWEPWAPNRVGQTCLMKRPRARTRNRLPCRHCGCVWVCSASSCGWCRSGRWRQQSRIPLADLANLHQLRRSRQPSSSCRRSSGCSDPGSQERRSSRSSRAPRRGMPSGRSGRYFFTGRSDIAATTGLIRMTGNHFATTSSRLAEVPGMPTPSIRRLGRSARRAGR
jgi:hypothetical protein